MLESSALPAQRRAPGHARRGLTAASDHQSALTAAPAPTPMQAPARVSTALVELTVGRRLPLAQRVMSESTQATRRRPAKLAMQLKDMSARPDKASAPIAGPESGPTRL